MAVILIVEDEIFTREIAELMIQDWGHQTFSASDVAEALVVLRSPQHIDLLFTDKPMRLISSLRFARDGGVLRYSMICGSSPEFRIRPRTLRDVSQAGL